MKRIISILLIFIMVITVAACSPKNPSTDNGGDKNPDIGIEDDNNKGKEDDVVDPSPKTDSKEVTLYFANGKYVETGDESLEKLIGEQREIEYGDLSLEEMIVKELMKGPENSELNTLIPTTAKLLGVEVAEGTAFVNFARDGMFGGGLQETFTISQIVESLGELDSVDRVQFLIDGQKDESLMGHYEITEPFEVDKN